MLMHWFVTYVACLISFLLLDGAWLAFVAAKLYRSELDILRTKPQLGIGIVFYLLYCAGIVAFSLYPLVSHFNGTHVSLDMMLRVFLWGTGLGIFAYTTYALTNQAVIEGWKLKLSILDLLWGGIVTGFVSVAGFAVFRALI